MAVEQQEHTSHTAGAVSMGVRYATSQEIEESLYNMTPPLCYADPGRPSTTNHYRLQHYARPHARHAKCKTYKTIVYPVMCDTSTCYSVLSMCWGDAGFYSSRPSQTFMQRTSHQLPLSPKPIPGITSKSSVGICHAVPGCVKVDFEILHGFRGCHAPPQCAKIVTCVRRIDRTLPSLSITLRVECGKTV
jgi:hypothetical protein